MAALFRVPATTHAIIAGQATRGGTYVALTRAREQTHIYHGATEDMAPGVDRLKALAERVSHAEPEAPSISTPLAHENAVTAHAEIAATDQITPTAEARITREPTDAPIRQPPRNQEGAGGREPATDPVLRDDDQPELLDERAELRLDTGERPAEPAGATERERASRRVWPGRETLGPDEPEWETKPLERDDSPGWEP